MSLASHIADCADRIPADARIGRKLAIAAVHAAVAPMMSADALKALLIEEHAAGHVFLSRCDMPRGFGDGVLESSETRHPSGAGIWHLVSVP